MITACLRRLRAPSALCIAAATALLLTSPAAAAPSECDGCGGDLISDASAFSYEWLIYDAQGNSSSGYVRLSVVFTPGTCLTVLDEQTNEPECVRLTQCSARISVEWKIASAFPCDEIGFCLMDGSTKLCLDDDQFPCADCSDGISCDSQSSNSSAYTISSACGNQQRFLVPISSEAIGPDQNGVPRGGVTLDATVGCKGCDEA